VIALLVTLAATLAPAQEAAEVREHVLPDAEELAWQGLGWRASLWQGVVDAQAAGKPILLWAMNGHPLGCT
jgi:hypothetical protein